jgi:hypothetical protein
MHSMSRSFAAIGVVGSLALAPSVVPRFWTNTPGSFELACGPHGEDPAGVVGIHLLEQAQRPHGKLTIASRLPDDPGDRGAISIESNAGGGRTMCGSVLPGHLSMRGTASFLNGTTLRVESQNPVRVEVRDSTGKVLAFQITDPVARRTAPIAW